MRNRLPALFVLLAAATLAAAQPISYSRVSRDIKAGTLLIDSQRVAGRLYNPAPHVWYAMDQERGIKPSSWTFVNPLGQTTLTNSMIQRWGLGGSYTVGQSLSKRDASYWEVDLANTTDAAMAQFDVLLLPLDGSMSLRASERERLRRFVDQGGILWIDLFTGAAVDLANSTPVPFEIATGGGVINANTNHPLLNIPNTVTTEEVGNLRGNLINVSRPVFGLNTALESVLSTVRPESFRWESISSSSTGSLLSTVKSGDGSMVLSSFALSDRVGSGPIYQSNIAFRSRQLVFDGVYNSAAKLIANIAGMGSSLMGPAGGSRKSGSIRGDVPAPLLKTFNVTDGGFERTTQAAHYNGRIYATAGDTINCFDAKPESDLDGDGNPDDGLVNPVDVNYDLVWSQNLGSRGSSPVVAETANSVSAAPNQVWVVTAEGRVRSFFADTGAPAADIAPASNVDTTVGPFAPTIHEGILIVTEAVSTGLGRVRLIDVAQQAEITSGANTFSLQGTSRLDIPTASASAGYIPILDNSGGLDRVIYVATKGSSTPAGLTSIWLGAKGESPARLSRSGNAVTVSTRASLQGLPVFVPGANSPYGVKITLLAPGTGRPLTETELVSSLAGSVAAGVTPGEIVVDLTGAGPFAGSDWDGTQTPSDTTDDIGWRVDYTIDWSRSALSNPSADSYIRGNLQLPDNGDQQRRIVGSPALTNRGHVIVAQTNIDLGRSAANVNEGGSTVYNFREEGRGDFVLVNRFDLFDGVRINYNGSTNLNYRETIVDEDKLLDQLGGILSVPMRDLRIVSGPSVQGDTVYIAATGFKSLGPFSVPTGVLLALEANPAPVQFFVRGLVVDSQDTYNIVQPDPVRSLSTNRTTPEQVTVLPQTAFTIEATTQVGLSKVTIPNLMTTPRGQIRDAISTSLPLIFRRSNGDTDILIEPEASGANGALQGGSAAGRWSPLRWFFVGNGFNVQAGPQVAGNTLYIGGSSVLPSILVSGFTALQENGLVYALDSEVSSNDPFLQANTVKPWFSQLNTVLPNSSAPWDVRAANAVRWPQPQGIRSFDDFRVRLLQNTIPEEAIVSLSAGDGSLSTFAASAQSLNVFGQADFSVVDSQRVSRFDAGGNPTWVLQNTSAFGGESPTSPASKSSVFVDPTRVYPDGNDSSWIVDAGSNRIVLVDRAGQELRTVKSIRVHPNRELNELSTGTNLNLSNPRDVSVFTRFYSAPQVAALFPGETLQETAGTELWRHILIADSGNKRAVELVDRYRVTPAGRVIEVVRYRDASGAFVPALGVALWHSAPELSGGQYGYNTIARLSDPLNPNNRITALGFSSTQPSLASVGLDSPNQGAQGATGFGGIVLYDDSRGDSLLIDKFLVPALPFGALLGDLSGGRYFFDSAATDITEKRISGLNSVTLRRIVIGGVRRLTVMISMSDGVYELIQSNPTGPTPADRNVWEVRWMLPNASYLAMRRSTVQNPTLGYSPADLGGNPVGFRPMHARRLDSGEVLIVNGYTGTTFGPSPIAFQGEVILVEGRFGGTDIPGYNLTSLNLGFNSLSIRYELPPVAGIRDLIRPVFAERR